MAINTGDKHTNLQIKCYDVMMGSEVVHDLNNHWKIEITPQKIVDSNSLDELCNNQIQIYKNKHENEDSIALGGPPYRCSSIRYEKLSEGFSRIKKEILELVSSENMTVENFITI